ncbi:hypothetical protein HELRODRAFT_75983 [Helobdella robusta]|uniref:Palmitoyltransferase n=1 Tax=Helobdella robusta TaxID=6412 RepID=T1G2D5_HELRO|nr:hypothetical protein HELRODRAFT_75983 [Helobdella robusta]ESO07779.1 hypothetical protein HELRODRAFT_75983 [Helobdella robusta]
MPCDATSNKNGNKVVVYHYWSWRPCHYCGIVRPPRSHHCKLCRCCVLKRDHHCFFATNCIGLNNQRHFVVFLFWTCCAITFCLIHSALYLFTRCVSNENCVDVNSYVVLPMTVVKMIRGKCTLMDLGLVVVLYSLVWFSFVCGTFFIEQLKLILSNLTPFEKERGIGIITSENKTNEVNSSQFHYAINRAIKYINQWNKSFFWVFGKHWMLNFFLPLHFIYPCPEDGMSWKSVDFCIGSSRA